MAAPLLTALRVHLKCLKAFRQIAPVFGRFLGVSLVNERAARSVLTIDVAVVTA
jgi:hypothetical protein